MNYLGDSIGRYVIYFSDLIGWYVVFTDDLIRWCVIYPIKLGIRVMWSISIFILLDMWVIHEYVSYLGHPVIRVCVFFHDSVIKHVSCPITLTISFLLQSFLCHTPNTPINPMLSWILRNKRIKWKRKFKFFFNQKFICRLSLGNQFANGTIQS